MMRWYFEGGTLVTARGIPGEWRAPDPVSRISKLLIRRTPIAGSGPVRSASLHFEINRLEMCHLF